MSKDTTIDFKMIGITYQKDLQAIAKDLINLPDEIKMGGTKIGRYTNNDSLTPGWSYKNLEPSNLINYDISDTKVAQAILDKFYSDVPWKDTKLKRGKKLRITNNKTTGWPNRNDVANAIETLGQFQEKVTALDKLSPDNHMQVLARMLCDTPGMHTMLVRMGVCNPKELGQITNLARRIAIKRASRLNAPEQDLRDQLDELICQKISSIVEPVLESKPYAARGCRVNIDIAGVENPFVTYDLGTQSIDLDIKPSWRSEERRVGKECRSRWSPYH